MGGSVGGSPVDVGGFEAALVGVLAGLEVLRLWVGEAGSVSERVGVLVGCERVVRAAVAVRVVALAGLGAMHTVEGDLERGATEAEVVAALRWPVTRVRNELAVAERLVRVFPETLDLLCRGVVCERQARAVVDLTVCLSDGDARTVQGRVLPRMAGNSVANTRASLRNAVARVDPGAAERRHKAARARRRVQVRAEDDGMATLALYAAAEVVGAIWNGVTEECARPAADDPRTLDQRRLDALTGRLLEAGTPGAGAGAVRVGALVQVVIPLGVLLGRSTEPCELSGYGPITAAHALHLAEAPGSVFQRLITDPRGMLLYVDPHRYKPTASMERTVRRRYRTCTFPGCTMPSSRCEIEHANPFLKGGTTTLDNLHPVCKHHHQLKTAGVWSVTATLEQVTWISTKTGEQYTTRPHVYPTGEYHNETSDL